VARPTRSQRRARREQAQGGGDQKLTQRARARQAQVRPASQPAKQQTGRREPVQRGKFVRESWGELKKVEWPGRNQVLQGTIVVIIACAIVGAYLWIADLGFKNLVENILLRQN
jgi:preprotein translocase subunit SecE